MNSVLFHHRKITGTHATFFQTNTLNKLKEIPVNGVNIVNKVYRELFLSPLQDPRQHPFYHSGSHLGDKYFENLWMTAMMTTKIGQFLCNILTEYHGKSFSSHSDDCIHCFNSGYIPPCLLQPTVLLWNWVASLMKLLDIKTLPQLNSVSIEGCCIGCRDFYINYGEKNISQSFESCSLYFGHMICDQCRSFFPSKERVEKETEDDFDRLLREALAKEPPTYLPNF
jgi:hypothetical protein